LVSGDVDEIVREDDATAALLGLPPYGALAEVSGPGASEFVTRLGAPARVHPTPLGFEVHADSYDELVAALRAVSRPAEKVRVAVR
jgi:hypothetical protein